MTATEEVPARFVLNAARELYAEAAAAHVLVPQIPAAEVATRAGVDPHVTVKILFELRQQGLLAPLTFYRAGGGNPDSSFVHGPPTD